MSCGVISDKVELIMRRKRFAKFIKIGAIIFVKYLKNQYRKATKNFSLSGVKVFGLFLIFKFF